MTKGRKILIAIVMCILLVVGIGCTVQGIKIVTAKDDKVAEQWFEPYEENQEKQYLDFMLISDPFAEFELSSKLGLYFVFDTDMYGYIVCMEQARVEKEFADIYEYTFSGGETSPGLGHIEGYAQPINSEMMKYAIEEYNWLWNEELINETNFEDYLGTMYLDTTIKPASEENPATLFMFGIFFIVVFIVGCVVSIRSSKKKVEEEGWQPQSQASVEDNMEVKTPGNIIIAIVASIICASAGALLWIVFFKMGKVTAIAGLAAVGGAIFGYTYLGKRELNIPSGIWCILIGLAMIVLGNAVGYAWDITDAYNNGTPGRAEFLKVFVKLPSLLTENELWRNFFADMALGLIFTVIGGISMFTKKRKEEKKIENE